MKNVFVFFAIVKKKRLILFPCHNDGKKRITDPNFAAQPMPYRD